MVNKFKVGDKVKRINQQWRGMKIGDTGIIINNNEFGIHIKGYGSGHACNNFEQINFINWKEEMSR